MTMTRCKWILLAEDNANDADLAMRALSSNHPPDLITWARDGLEALDCLYHRGELRPRCNDPPTLVLLDLKMPRVDGMDVLQKIKSDQDLKGVPVVVFTSSSQEEDIARCYELGANAYVVKPLDFQGLGSVLAKICDFWMHLNEPPNAALRSALNAAHVVLAA